MSLGQDAASPWVRRSWGERAFLAALVVVAAVLVVLARASPEPAAAPAPTPTPTLVQTVPPVGALTPEQPGSTDLENTAEVQALRRALEAAAWAALHLTCDFPDAGTWLHPDFLEYSWLCRHGIRGPGDGVALAGPEAFEPREVTYYDDGSVDVLTCRLDEPDSRFSVFTREPAPRGSYRGSLVTSRLVMGDGSYQLLPASLLSSDPCEPHEPIVTQTFVGWQDTPLFTSFYTGPADDAEHRERVTAAAPRAETDDRT